MVIWTGDIDYRTNMQNSVCAMVAQKKKQKNVKMPFNQLAALRGKVAQPLPAQRGQTDSPAMTSSVLWSL